MKLTKDDIILDYECMDNILIWTKESEQLRQQILDDHEKARKYEKCFEGLTDEMLKSIKITFKLRELIEKRIELLPTHEAIDTGQARLRFELQKLLEESNK